MKTTKVLIGGRYQYTPSQPLKETQLYSEFRAYDKSTKRDLIMHKLQQQDAYIDRIRDIKHPFIHPVFDVVNIEDQGKITVFFQPGPQASLQQALHKTHYLTENDALVIFKFALLALKELHEKLIIYQRMCAQNILFCTHSLIKLGSFAYPSQVPMQNRSPQVLRSEKATYASDIYSLATVLYQMLYGCYPFDASSEDNLLSQIKSKKFRQNQTSSPFKILVSKQLRVLLGSMLDYYPENRPSLQNILKVGILAFPVETQAQAYIKPKTNIMPQPFLRKYLVFRASRLLYRIDDYYEQSCYLALNIKDKQFVSLYTPDVKMFESDPRRVQSYFEKLRAIKESYLPETCGFLCKIDDFQRFRREPILALQYCNQGDLFHYLEKYKKDGDKSLSQKQINILMYLLAIAYKQIRDVGVTSIHTVHCQRIMIKNKNIKIRQPGLLTPFIEHKLITSTKIDYFAPELKQKSDFVQLDKSDMWSYGILYYYLLQGSLPQLTQQQKTINIDILPTNRKNKNLIAKCLDQNVSKRLSLQQIKIEGVNEQLLENMLEQKRKQDEQDEIDNESISQNNDKLGKDHRVIFKNRKKKWFKHYNQIIAGSSTSHCRVITKIVLGLVVLWVVFFGGFFVNGGVGMLRTNYYRKITQQVPYNYATSLYNLTILSTNGTKFQNEYKDYSYQQYTIDLKCTQNNHTLSQQSIGEVYDYINYSHSVQCFFGFVFAILISICYAVIQVKLDLPKVLIQRKDKGNNSGIFHFVIVGFVVCALLFCFFTVFVFEYVVQMQPCLGIVDHGYPKFTAVETLLNGDVGSFMKNIFPTVILWSILMILYIFLSLLHKKINARIMQYKFIIIAAAVMLIYTLVCRIGFGSATPIQPSWSYKINKDITSQYWGLFGFFPQILYLPLLCLDRVVDFVFWFFLRLGMEPAEEEDIMEVEFNAKLDPVDPKQLQGSKSNIIHNDFQLFD